MRFTNQALSPQLLQASRVPEAYISRRQADLFVTLSSK